MNKKIFDCFIIGGGAAGLCCAISLKSENPQLSVAVAEQLSRVGKKLITTGNGRCNITNKNISLDRYHSKNLKFCEFILKNYGVGKITDFFNALGVCFVYEDNGKAYPYSLQASSVVDALRFKCDETGVETYTDTAVTQVKKSGNIFEVSASGETYFSKTVLFATGLFAGGSKLGSNGTGFNILKNMGYKAVNTYPAIVQLKTETDTVRQLKGIKVNADVTLKTDNKVIRKEYGEVLFCDYGLSGPPILQLSGEIHNYSAQNYIYLDLCPETAFDTLFDMLKSRKEFLKLRNNEEFLTGFLNKRVGQVILKLCNITLNSKVSNLDDNDLRNVASKIKKFGFKVTGNTGYENSQVTAGGIDTLQFDETTMMSKTDKGLFCAGEILDVYGDCGGFNLTFAFGSAMCASDGIIKYLGGKL